MLRLLTVLVVAAGVVGGVDRAFAGHRLVGYYDAGSYYDGGPRYAYDRPYRRYGDRPSGYYYGGPDNDPLYRRYDDRSRGYYDAPPDNDQLYRRYDDRSRGYYDARPDYDRDYGDYGDDSRDDDYQRYDEEGDSDDEPSYGYGYDRPRAYRPRSCGVYRYWTGRNCVDARFLPPYVGPKY